MHKQENQPTKGAIGVQDFLYILFKHKWKIVLLSLIGFCAAATVFMIRKPVYQSEAKLLVKYVLMRENIDTFQSEVSPPGAIADHVINTEVEILNSSDLALAVADAVGVDHLTPEAEGHTTPADAAAMILGNLETVVVPGNNVIHIKYRNESKPLATSVLSELIKQYFVKHLEIHRSAAAFDLVSKQVEESKARLKETESQLNKLKTGSGIISLAQATTSLAAQRSKTQEDLMKAKAELAEQEARMKAFEKTSGIDGLAADSKGASKPSDQAAELLKQIPAHIITEYKTMLELLAFLQKRDLELRVKFTPGNRLITLNQQQITDCESKRQQLVKQYPQLMTEVALLNRDTKDPKLSLMEEQAHLAAVQARVEVFNSHLEELKNDFNNQYAIGADIDVLERKKQMEDAEYRSLELNLKNAKIDQTLDPSRMPNITMVQQPSQPIKTYEKETQKIILAFAGAGVGLGIGIALLLELLIDRRVSRPFEIQTRLQLPLLLSIPYIPLKERTRKTLSDETDVGSLNYGEQSAEEGQIKLQNSPKTLYSNRKANHYILPYSETIRDRIIFNFEVNNVTHKPKLVAVAGLSEGAGASTIAAGLAKSFADINRSKVLLVDLSSHRPEDNPMFGEVPRHSLNGALQIARSAKFKDSRQNLYYASANARRDDRNLSSFSPMHLYELMPHLQASQYDYIIFDMPSINQTSRTLTMASLMDKVLLVLDAENTSRDALKWGYSELVKGKADVSCIFNKTRSHAPGWLIGES